MPSHRGPGTGTASCILLPTSRHLLRLLFLLPKAAAPADARTRLDVAPPQSTHSSEPRIEGGVPSPRVDGIGAGTAGSRKPSHRDRGRVQRLALHSSSDIPPSPPPPPSSESCSVSCRCPHAYSWASRLHSPRTAESHVSRAPPSFARRWHRRRNPTFGDPGPGQSCLDLVLRLRYVADGWTFYTVLVLVLVLLKTSTLDLRAPTPSI
jgi:hypothetical protein